jgi:hypothetical protein
MGNEDLVFLDWVDGAISSDGRLNKINVAVGYCDDWEVISSDIIVLRPLDDL